MRLYVCLDLARRIYYIRLVYGRVCVWRNMRAICSSSDVVATTATTTPFNDERNVEKRLLEQIQFTEITCERLPHPVFLLVMHLRLFSMPNGVKMVAAGRCLRATNVYTFRFANCAELNHRKDSPRKMKFFFLGWRAREVALNSFTLSVDRHEDCFFPGHWISPTLFTCGNGV